MKPLDASLEFKLKTLRRNPYFDDLPEEMLKEIAGRMQLRGYERGEILFWEGDACAGLHIIEAGSVKLYRISPQGRQYIVRVLQEGETCNEVPAFDGGTNPVNVETLGKSTPVSVRRSTSMQPSTVSLPSWKQDSTARPMW